MNKEMGVSKAWEATVRRTQAAKKRANSLFGMMSVAHVDDDNNISGKIYQVERVLPNNDYYSGQWLDNFPHGQGKYLWIDGCMYVGGWFKGKTMGKGRFSWPSGATYEGEFKSGYMDGIGTYIGSTGDTYKGQWIMNLKHGHGVKNYASGDLYEGEWRRGLQERQGRYQWKNGSYYIGEWKNGEICGKGTFVWTNGNRYDGFWENGMPKGNGTFKWLDGSFYVGNWSKDPSEQNGTYYPSRSSPKANLKWDPHDVYNVDFGDCKICPSEKVSIFPSQKKLALWRSSKSGVNLKPKRMSADGRVNVGMERPLDGFHMLDGDESGDVGSRISMVGNLEDDLLGIRINDASPRGLPVEVPRRENKQGETIWKGHKNYELMLTLQLGIRHSVGRPAPTASLDLKPSAFGPKEKVWTRFPPEGSKYTPPHQSSEFRWKDYCPLVFRTLRKFFNVNPADYMISICGNDALRELSSPSKSGSFFYLTNDDRYMIKTIKKAEVKVLLKMLTAYYNHVRAFENTLVTKFYGLHCVKLTGPIQKKVRFIIMGNLFCTEYTIHRRFDLKGSSLGRTTNMPGTEIDETSILKDLDLNFIFRLQKLWFQEFCRHKKIISANSDTSSGRPLCHCGVPAYLRNSWTNANFGRKWYGCVNYKKPGDCELFEWADHEMCIYEKRLMERLKDKEEGMRAEIARLEKLMETKLTKYKANMESQSAQYRVQLELYQTREKLYQSREKMYQAALVFVILLMLFYISSYNNASSSKMMLR